MLRFTRQQRKKKKRKHFAVCLRLDHVSACEHGDVHGPAGVSLH